MSKEEEQLQELVNQFLNGVPPKGNDQTHFDQCPALARLISNTFEPRGHTTRIGIRSGYIVFSIVLVPIIALIAPALFNGTANRCLWRMPYWMIDLSMKSKNCAMCAGLTEVDRLEKIMHKEDFISKYVESGVPVVVTDATKDWPARETFSLEFFRSVYLNKTLAHCQFFSYVSKFQSIQHVLEEASRGQGELPWYVGWSNCDIGVSELLRAHYGKPYFLPENSESAHTDWIFMGRPGYGAKLHVDFVQHPSWQAQIRGRKRWLLHPPPECHYSCPRQFLEVTVGPGDTLVVNTNLWYHQTMVVGDELSISFGAEFD